MSSDSDDENVVRYGTPLEPYEEDEIPSKKKFQQPAEQFALDAHGRRRFHGAFTGGFSAGFQNTVGTAEGWKPATFKSSRAEKAQSSSQRPEDFMDDEDRGEHGIAPRHMQTQSEFSGRKRPRQRQFHDGPIPGMNIQDVPVNNVKWKRKHTHQESFPEQSLPGPNWFLASAGKSSASGSYSKGGNYAPSGAFATERTLTDVGGSQGKPGGINPTEGGFARLYEHSRGVTPRQARPTGSSLGKYSSLGEAIAREWDQTDVGGPQGKPGGINPTEGGAAHPYKPATITNRPPIERPQRQAQPAALSFSYGNMEATVVPGDRASQFQASFAQNWHWVGDTGQEPRGRPKPAQSHGEHAETQYKEKRRKMKPNKKQRSNARLRTEQAASRDGVKLPLAPVSIDQRQSAEHGQGFAVGAAQQRVQRRMLSAGSGGKAARKQKSAARPGKIERIAAVKRARLDGSRSGGEAKKQRVDGPLQPTPPNSASAAKKEIGIVILVEGNKVMDTATTTLVQRHLQSRLIQEAMGLTQTPSSDGKGPVFRGKPTREEGALKLWCADQKTVEWVRTTISDVALPSGEKLVLRYASDMPKRVRIGFLVPDAEGLWGSPTAIGQALLYQNPWAGCDRWLVLPNTQKQKEGWFMMASVPEDVVPAIIAEGRRLACGLGAVYVKFQGLGGKFFEIPPGDTRTSLSGLTVTNRIESKTDTATKKTAAPEEEQASLNSPCLGVLESEMLGSVPNASFSMGEKATRTLAEIDLDVDRGLGESSFNDGEPFVQ